MLALLSLDKVSLKYPGDANKPVLEDISFSVQAGELIAIVGPSGCGKSSTISLLAGLIEPQEGTILLSDQPVKGPGLDRAVVFQDYSLFPWMSALENISFALKQEGRHSKKEALDFLEIVGISGAAHKYPSELSGGMKQRVAIARAFALEAPVYLMDEPFGAVDAKNRIYLQDLLLRLWGENEKKKTIVIVTHDIDEAMYLADRIIVFSPSPGRVRRIIDVPFERPRTRNYLIHDPRYIDMRTNILSLLQNDLISELNNVEGGEGI